MHLIDVQAKSFAVPVAVEAGYFKLLTEVLFRAAGFVDHGVSPVLRVSPIRIPFPFLSYGVSRCTIVIPVAILSLLRPVVRAL